MEFLFEDTIIDNTFPLENQVGIWQAFLKTLGYKIAIEHTDDDKNNLKISTYIITNKETGQQLAARLYVDRFIFEKYKKI